MEKRREAGRVEESDMWREREREINLQEACC